MPVPTLRSAAALAPILLLLVACGSDGTDPRAPSRSADGTPPRVAAAALDAGAATIDYRYRDGSIPPPNYRERTLTVTPALSRLVVADRDTVLQDTVVETEPAAVEETLRRLSESDLPAELDDGCTGGPSHRLDVRDAAGETVRAVAVICPSNRVDAGDELRGIVAPLFAQFEPPGPGGSPDGR